jgi:hypothetical protein
VRSSTANASAIGATALPSIVTARPVTRKRKAGYTLGVRLVSVVDDDVQHVGQAAYVRGLLP